MKRRTGYMLTGLLASALAVTVGCEDPVEVGGSGGGRRGGRGRASRNAAAAAPADTAAAAAQPEFAPGDQAFVEVDVQNRDPFRDYAQMFKVRNVQAPQRRVLLPTLSIDQMRLKAIISGVPQPVAQVVDEHGVGHTIRRGDYIGRPEVIQTGGPDGVTVMLNWRVDRIRPNEVVLTREDPNAPDQLPLTRIIPLHDPREELNVPTVVP